MSETMPIIKCTQTQFEVFEAEPGQVICIVDDDNNPIRLTTWTGTEWQDVKTDGGISMSIYDVNKQIIHQFSKMSKKMINEKKKIIKNFCDETNNKFYMLLCRDINYFTLFNRIDNSAELESISDLVIECAKGVGEIKSIDLSDGGIEIWVDQPFENSTYAMYFFPYDGGVELCQ